MQRKGISCRFRKQLDADLIAATAALSDGELSELARNGLRLMLGIRKAPAVEIRERPLTVPEAKEKTAAVPLTGKPAVFIPNQRPKV
ncbi:hypothetical protein [Gorillibacterium sp. sgz5001074]|uniref:hypothetical protein n=1 Tax=Gorillibacterium sp. sgz5001074 TaxID=3446695 RepID=UPI003F67AC0C